MKLLKASAVITAALICFCLFCSREVTKNNAGDNKSNIKNNGYNETFKKTGWISETKYRAVIYILTLEECNGSTREQVEEKIKYEAIKHLQAEMNITFTHNQHSRANNLIANYGLMSPVDFKCTENNIFYFDIEKKDLKLEFQNIKNIR